MKTRLLFALWIVCALTAHGQVLAPASDGHILRNETYQFTLGTGDPTGVTGLTYFAYFRDLYVGGENSFTYDFDPNDGISTHYNRELRSILEFNISSLNLTPGSFTAYLDLATDDNFYPVAPYTLQVKAANLAHGQEDGSLTQSDYSALDGDLDTQTVDGQNFPQNYSFNITAGLNDDLTGGGTYSGFILYSDALNGNEISFVSSYEQSQGGGSGPQLRIVGVQPDISVNVGPCQATLIGSTYAVPVEVTNAGSADLVVDEVFELQDSGNVYALDLSGFLTTLPSGESSSFAILFSPVSEGSFSGSFRITSNDPDESTYTFALNCLGISTPQPDIDVSSDPCTDTPVGGSSAIDVLVENSGTADLIISGVTESEDSFSAFTLDLDGFQNTISSGTSSTFKVRFNPITTGEQSAAYQISSNDPDQPVVTITVSCKAYASGQNPGIEVNPVPVVISGVKAGTSGNKIVTLKNTGEGTLTISSIDLSGSSSLTLDASATKMELLNGEQTTLMIQYSPTLPGYDESVLSIASNDPENSNLDVLVYGTATLNGVSAGEVTTGEAARDIMVPACALLPGAFGSFFVTDVKLHNTGNSAVQVAVYFLASAQDNRQALRGDLSLNQRQTMGIRNILGSLFGLEDNSFGALLFIPSGPGLRVTSRTYNLAEKGTYGQNIPGEYRSDALVPGKETYFPGLTKSSTTRSNVGFANVGSESAAIVINLYNASGDPLVENFPVELLPYSHKQFDVFSSTGASSTDNAFAVITVSSGSVFGYASILDNDTSDPIYVPLK